MTTEPARKNTLVTVLCVVGAVLIAWFLVDIVLSAVFFLVKAAIVLVIAVVVYFVLRVLLARGSSRDV
jgi:multisubunit Na+/H+ antiporter MnhG subunit